MVNFVARASARVLYVFLRLIEGCFALASRAFLQTGGRAFYAPSALEARHERGTSPQSLLDKSTSRSGILYGSDGA